jgi:hypothetical protein
MAADLTGLTPGGVDDTYKWLAHFGVQGALPADGGTPVALYKGDGTATPIAMTATKLFVNGIEVLAAKNKLNATVAPTVDDDVTFNYSVGSKWYDLTAQEAYLCFDATNGAAAWEKATLTADELGDAAFKNTGTGAGTVAAGNDSRFADERVPTAAGLTSKFGTNKATIANGDKVTILDSAVSFTPKHVLWSLIVSTLTAAFNSLYATAAQGTTAEGALQRSGGTMTGNIKGTQLLADDDSQSVLPNTRRLIGSDGTTTTVDWSGTGYNSGAAMSFAIGGYDYSVQFGFNANGNNYGVAVGVNSNGYNGGAAVGYNANGNTSGAAVGYYANGNTSGAAVGYYANGNTSGAAVGYNADGNNGGAAVGYNANGNTSGAAVGTGAYATYGGVALGNSTSVDTSQTNTDNSGNIAIGGDLSYVNCAKIAGGLLDTVMLGRGTAPTQGLWYGVNGTAYQVMDGSGSIKAGLPIVTATYTVGTVPSAVTYARGLIYVPNELGGAVIAFSDGTNWRRVTDRAIIS